MTARKAANGRKPGTRAQAAAEAALAATRAAQGAFLEAYGNSGIVLVGTRAARVSRELVEQWLEDAAFAELFARATMEASDRIRAEMQRRGVTGVTRTEDVYHAGEVVGQREITEYSDRLLLELAKGDQRPALPSASRGALAEVRRLHAQFQVLIEARE